MIVDCHTHVWQSPDQLGQLDLGEMQRTMRTRTARLAANARPVWRTIPSADADHHYAQTASVDKSIVLGFKSRYLRAEVPNKYVAEYVNRYPQKLIGFYLSVLNVRSPYVGDALRQLGSGLDYPVDDIRSWFDNRRR